MSKHLEKKARAKQVTYTTTDGEEVTASLIVIPAIMKSIPTKVRTNAKDTPWRLVTVSINHPTKGEVTGQAQLFENSFIAHPDSFAVGSEIEVEIQTEGEGKGYGKVQLPEIEKFDVDAFATTMAAVEETA